MNKSLTATLKYALMSDKKLSLIAKLVRGKKVDEALDVLKFLPKKGARTLYKVLFAAVSNAKNAGFDKNLYIKEIKVGAGPKIKRVRFSSRSRISHYIKYRAFVQVILDVKEVKGGVPKVTKAVTAKKPAVKKPEVKTVVKKTEDKKPVVKKPAAKTPEKKDK